MPAPKDGVMETLDMEKYLYWMGVYVEGGHWADSEETISEPNDPGDVYGRRTHWFGLTPAECKLAGELGYSELAEYDGWAEPIELDILVDIYLALIEEQKAYVKEKLGEDIPDGYLQAFMSLYHHSGKLTKRGEVYKSKGSVAESEWVYNEFQKKFEKPFTNRRKAEYAIITEGRYLKCYDGLKELEFSSETPFTDFCKEHGVNNIQVRDPE